MHTARDLEDKNSTCFVRKSVIALQLHLILCPFSLFVLGFAQYLGLKLPLAAIYNPCIKHIHTQPSHTHNSGGQLFRRSWHSGMWHLVGWHVNTCLHHLWDRQKGAHTVEAVDEDICPAAGHRQALMSLECVSQSKVFHVCEAIRAKPLRLAGLEWTADPEEAVLEPCACALKIMQNATR